SRHALTVTGTNAYARLALGAYHTCGLTTQGDVYCWGRNDVGQLGSSPTNVCSVDLDEQGPKPYACNLAPTRVTSNVKFQSIAAGDAFTCALSTTGQIFCWGAGASGQLGDGQGLARGTPAPVVSDLKFRSLTAGAQHACAITDRGAGY